MEGRNSFINHKKTSVPLVLHILHENLIFPSRTYIYSAIVNRNGLWLEFVALILILARMCGHIAERIKNSRSYRHY